MATLFGYGLWFGDLVEHVYHPDFVTYYQLAKHWAAGRYNLAVSGHWGPLISWAMAPFIGLFSEPAWLGRAFVYLGAILYIASAQFLFRICGLRPGLRLAGGIATALFAVNWTAKIITPDLAFSAVIIVGFALLYRSLQRDSIWWSIAAGSAFALAYITKPAGMPIGLAAIVGLGVAAVVLDKMPVKKAARKMAISAVALLAIASPWVATLSIHYGQFTWTRVIGVAQEVSEGSKFPNWTVFHEPRPGRIVSTEDPGELYSHGGVAPSSAPTDYTKVVLYNLGQLAKFLAKPHWLGIVLIAIAAAVIPYRTGKRIADEPWRWGAVASALVISPYIISFAGQERYYLACMALGTAAGLGLFAWWRRHDTSVVPGPRLAAMYGLLALFGFSILIAPIIKNWNHHTWLESLQHKSSVARARVLGEALRNKGLVGDVADVGETDHISLYLAFKTQQRYLGWERQTPDIDSVLAMGVQILVSGEDLADTLASDDRLQDITNDLPARLNARGKKVHVFAVRDGSQAHRSK